MERNGDYIEKEVIVYLLRSINYEIKNILGFHLTHPPKKKQSLDKTENYLLCETADTIYTTVLCLLGDIRCHGTGADELHLRQ